MAKSEIRNQKSEIRKKSKKDVSIKASEKVKKKLSEPKKSSRKVAVERQEISQTKPVKKASGKPAESMEELLKQTGYSFNVPKQGATVEGVVTEVSKKMILLDIGGKTEGIVVDREYEAAYEVIKDTHVGDRIKAVVISPENDRGQILLSLKREAAERSWDHYVEMMETEEILVVKGVEVNKGGLIVQAGSMRGFVPSSQFGKKLAGQIEDLINRPIRVKVIEADKEKNRLIFSERHVSEAEILEKKSEALKEVKEGDVLEGTVSGVMPFGAFVTVAVPLTSTTGTKSKKRDPSTARTSAASRRAQDDKAGVESVPALSNVKEEEVELDGLVHISEISWEKVNDPNDYFRMGDRVKVKVLSVDKEAGKLNLSAKRLSEDPWATIEKRFAIGSKYSGTITRVEPFGAFVNFEAGVDGLIHISKIPAGEDPAVGNKIDVFVETVDAEHRRMSLSMVYKTTEKLIYK